MGGILCHVLVTVMVGRIKLSFHHRVFILLLTFCWVLVGTFMVFQYFREKEFKTELFNTELQAYNASIIDGLRKGGDTRSQTSIEGSAHNLDRQDRQGDI